MGQETKLRAMIGVSTPHRVINGRLELITPQWQRSRMFLTQPLGYNLAEIFMDGYQIDVARCNAVDLAIERKYKYLFFLDNDVIIPANTLRVLIYHADNNPDLFVFSGVYFTKRHPPEPLIWREELGAGVSWNWKLGDVLKDVIAVGCGCMLIRCSVFEKLEKPYFNTFTEFVDNQMGGEAEHRIGEDVWFCKQVVEKTGTRILVDTGLQCLHIDKTTGEIYGIPKDCYPVC